VSIKNSIFKSEVRKELNFHFGDFFFFDGFVVSEIKEGIVFSWEHARSILDEVSEFYGEAVSGHHIIYISNRIHEYNVKPVDWLRFTMFAFKLKGYAVIARSSIEKRNARLEAMFIPAKFKIFPNVFEAIQWVTQLNDKQTEQRNSVDQSS